MTLLCLALAMLVYLPLWASSPYRPGVVPLLCLVPPAFFLLFFCRQAARRRRLRLGGALIVCLAVRALFVFQAPSLSEDIYRYFWDALQTAQGESPYLQAPVEAKRLRVLQPETYELMAHRDRRSIYPPGAQYLFLLNHWLWGPSPSGWKILLLICESILAWVFLARFRTPLEDFLLWGLNPLVIVEFYSSGHLDLAVLTLLALAFWRLRLTRRAWTSVETAMSAFFLAAAALVKVFPIFFAPLAAARQIDRRQKIVFAAALLASVALLTIPLTLIIDSPANSIFSLAEALMVYQSTWRFNSLPFYYLESRRSILGPAAAVSFIVICLAVARRAQASRSFDDWAALGYFLTMALYCLSHTMHPWYVTWGLIFYPLLGLRYWAGIYLSGASMLSYLAYASQPPMERAWVLWAVYLPFYSLLLRDASAYYGRRDATRSAVRQNQTGW